MQSITNFGECGNVKKKEKSRKEGVELAVWVALKKKEGI